MRKGIVAVAIFVAVYVATIVLYSHSGMGRPHEIAHGQPGISETTVICDVEELASVKGVLTANLTVVPRPELLDPVTHGLKDDLSVVVTSAVVPTKRTWAKGIVPGVFPISFTVAGDPSSWPFDRYETGPVTVEVFEGDQGPQRASVSVFDRIPGWKVGVVDAANGVTPTPYHVVLHRSPSTAAFAAIILAVLITLAALALFVAVETVARRREFFPPMTT